MDTRIIVEPSGFYELALREFERQHEQEPEPERNYAELAQASVIATIDNALARMRDLYAPDGPNRWRMDRLRRHLESAKVAAASYEVKK